jgi:hypothetical protein
MKKSLSHRVRVASGASRVREYDVSGRVVPSSDAPPVRHLLPRGEDFFKETK